MKKMKTIKSIDTADKFLTRSSRQISPEAEEFFSRKQRESEETVDFYLSELSSALSEDRNNNSEKGSLCLNNAIDYALLGGFSLPIATALAIKYNDKILADLTNVCNYFINQSQTTGGNLINHPYETFGTIALGVCSAAMIGLVSNEIRVLKD